MRIRLPVHAYSPVSGVSGSIPCLFSLLDCVKNKKFTKSSYLKKTETGVIELSSYEHGAKESITHFEVVKIIGSRTLLIGQLDSGRTHQLRVQLSSMGHPIVGDKKYNPKTKTRKMLLHSYYLDIKKYNLKFELPIPDDFLNL